MSIDTDAIKQNTDLLAIVESDLGPPAKRSGRVSHWRCPFHDDHKTPSLAVYEDGGYKCFGCGASGDVISWVETRQDVDFREACQRLTGGELPTADAVPKQRPPVKLAEPPPAEWQYHAAHFMVECHKALWDNPEAMAWLERQRGITAAAVGHWCLGINALAQQQRWGIGEPGKVWLPKGYTIPHWQQSNDTLWGLQVWRPPGSDPKYQKVTGSRANMIGVDSLAGHDAVFVTEGEFDCLLLSQAVGDLAAVVTFGAATTKEIDCWLPHLLPVKRLLICTDADDAGEKAWQYWHVKTKRAERLLPPGEVKDITDAWKAGHDLREWVEAVL